MYTSSNLQASEAFWHVPVILLLGSLILRCPLSSPGKCTLQNNLIHLFTGLHKKFVLILVNQLNYPVYLAKKCSELQTVLIFKQIIIVTFQNSTEQ